MIITKEVRAFFSHLAYLVAVVEDCYRHRSGAIKDAEKSLAVVATDELLGKGKFICQLAKVRSDGYHDWIADSSRTWTFEGGGFLETTGVPTRAYDFVVGYASTERYSYGLLVWVESEKVQSHDVGKKSSFIALDGGVLGTTEYTPARTGLYDITGNRTIYKTCGKLNVISREFTGICNPKEEWVFQCVHETFPGREKGVRFWKPIELVKGLPEVEISEAGIIMKHASPHPQSQIQEEAVGASWDVSGRKLWISASEKFFPRPISIFSSEEIELKKIASKGKIVGASFCYNDGANDRIDLSLGKLKIRVETSPIKFVLHSYERKLNLVSGSLTATEIGLNEVAVEGDFLGFAQHEGDFMRKCRYCDRMATATLNVVAISNCTCHDDYMGHIHWDHPGYVVEKAFCPDHELEARREIEGIPVASRKDDKQGRLSEEPYRKSLK